jgi:hypothetical protein
MGRRPTCQSPSGFLPHVPVATQRICSPHTPTPAIAMIADRRPPAPCRPMYAAATLSPERLCREGKHHLLSTSPLPLLVGRPSAATALLTPPRLKLCAIILVRPSIAVERCSHPRDKPTIDAPPLKLPRHPLVPPPRVSPSSVTSGHGPVPPPPPRALPEHYAPLRLASQRQQTLVRPSTADSPPPECTLWRAYSW